MPRKRRIPGGVVATGENENADVGDTTESETRSQSFTLIQLTPRQRSRAWKKIYGRIAVGESDGEVFINPAILGPWAGLCAIIDGVDACIKGEPIFVPITWAIQEYPHHAGDLRKLIFHVERALRKEKGAK
jgi:hypothetical protein